MERVCWRQNYGSSPSRLFCNLFSADDFRQTRERDVCQYVSYNARSWLLFLIMCRLQVQPRWTACTKERARTLAYARSRTHACPYVRRRRLKRLPTSIALAINVPSASSFCLSLQNARFRIIDVHLPRSPSPRPPFLIIPRTRVGVAFFGVATRVFFIIPDNSHQTFVFRSFTADLLNLSIFRAMYAKDIAELLDNIDIAEAFMLSYIKNFQL